MDYYIHLVFLFSIIYYIYIGGINYKKKYNILKRKYKKLEISRNYWKEKAMNLLCDYIRVIGRYLHYAFAEAEVMVDKMENSYIDTILIEKNKYEEEN